MTLDPAQAVSAALLAIRRQIAQGIVDAASEVRRQSVQMAPADTGNLRRSAEVAIDGTKSTTASTHSRVITVQFTAPYASRVHDASGKGKGKPRQRPHHGKYWDPPGSKPQFLRKAVESVRPRLRTYITRRVSRGV